MFELAIASALQQQLLVAHGHSGNWALYSVLDRARAEDVAYADFPADDIAVHDLRLLQLHTQLPRRVPCTLSRFNHSMSGAGNRSRGEEHGERPAHHLSTR